MGSFWSNADSDHLRLAQQHYDDKKFQDAINNYNQITNLKETAGFTGTDLYQLGYCYYMIQKYEDAIKWFSEYITNREAVFHYYHDYMTEARYYRSDCYYQLKKYNEALLDLNKLIKCYDTAKYYNLRATIYETTGYLEEALKDHKKVFSYSTDLKEMNETEESIKRIKGKLLLENPLQKQIDELKVTVAQLSKQCDSIV